LASEIKTDKGVVVEFMKKFRFKLEPVLIERQKEEKAKLAEQKRIEQFYLERLHLKERIEEKMFSYVDDISNSKSDRKSSGDDLWHKLVYIENLKAQIVNNDDQVKKMEEELQKVKLDTMNVRKKRMVIEKLKELKREEHKETVKKAEEKSEDEIVNSIYNGRVMLFAQHSS